MNLPKTVARHLLFPAITSLRIETLFSKLTKSNHLILMYHGVVKHTDYSISANHLSEEQFRKHLVYLKKNFQVVPLSEIFEHYRQKKIPGDGRKMVAITFDDGYENNYSNAFPLLKEFKLPATIFVTAGFVGNHDDLLWYDKLDILKNKIDLKAANEVDSALKKINSFSELRSYLKSVNTAEKNRVLGKLISRESLHDHLQQTDREYWKMLSKEQMKEMADSGLIEIGSHSLTHPNLDVLSDDELKSELFSSRKILEEATGKPVTSIAFPDGAYNHKVKQFALQAGYENLLAVDYRLNEDATDKNILPRFCISNTTTMESNLIQMNLGFSSSGF